MATKLPVIESTHHGATMEAMVVYLRFRKAKVKDTREISECVFADYDNKGRLIGIEFADPKSYNMALSSFQHVDFYEAKS